MARNIRYNNRTAITLDREFYKQLLDNRSIYGITHYSTPSFDYNTSGVVPFEVEAIIWKQGDRLHKMSQKYYNSVEYWWVIAFINQKPTDSHFQTGDTVLVPTSLERVLQFIGVI